MGSLQQGNQHSGSDRALPITGSRLAESSGMVVSAMSTKSTVTCTYQACETAKGQGPQCSPNPAWPIKSLSVRESKS